MILKYSSKFGFSWHRHGDIIAYQPGQQRYQTEIGNLDGRSIYVIKVYIVDSRGQVIGVTDEVPLGTQSPNSCMGPQGAPVNLRTYYAAATSITYIWDRPSCDEKFGPVEGFEYLVRKGWFCNQFRVS